MFLFFKQVFFYILVGTCLNIVTGKMLVIYPLLHGFGNPQHNGIFCFMDFSCLDKNFWSVCSVRSPKNTIDFTLF